jgi:divalent metal cation (Fe/Co/Zn/Cd) transporter
LREAHLVASALERRLHRDVPRAIRIVVHTEPDDSHDDLAEPVLASA